MVKLLNLASQLSCDADKLESKPLLFGLNQTIIEAIVLKAKEQAAKAAQSLGINLPTQEAEHRTQDHQQALAERIKQKDSSHSGLGLIIVKNLNDELSGSINCTSKRGAGTRFQLYLPRTG
jgi:signal transduction histidine kinase